MRRRIDTTNLSTLRLSLIAAYGVRKAPAAVLVDDDNGSVGVYVEYPIRILSFNGPRYPGFAAVFASSTLAKQALIAAGWSPMSSSRIVFWVAPRNVEALSKRTVGRVEDTRDWVGQYAYDGMQVALPD